ncbi:MAG: Fic family protein [Salibacteraceae bacterium]|nr:Fic family protein [Salibacteraceae bacterium]
MKTLAAILQRTRLEQGLKTKDLAVVTGIDQALISKFENAKRIPTEDQTRLLANALRADVKEFENARLAEKVYELLKYTNDAHEILALAEERVEYLTSSRVFEVQNLSDSLLNSLKRIDVLAAEWRKKKPLNQLQLSKMLEYFKVKYTYESNQIEGNTLSYRETHLVVNEGITIGSKSLREHLEAINHADAVDFVAEMISKDDLLTKRTLLELHSLVLKGIDRKYAGKYRDFPVSIGGSRHLPPDHMMLDQLMQDYFMHYMRQRGSMHPVILAAEMHERLVTIHPFADGNGRTSRLVMNLILLSNGYTLASLKGDYESRMRYYEALESVQIDNDSTPFYELVCEVVEASLQEHLALT